MRQIGADQRAHPGTGGEKHWQRGKAGKIFSAAAQMQVAVQHKVCCFLLFVGPEIHQQKGKVVEDIDGSDLLAEFDGIKEFGLIRLDNDIAGMHVAMAAAHQAFLAACVQ